MKNLLPFSLANEPMILASDNIFNITKLDYEDDQFSINVCFKDNMSDIEFDYQNQEMRDKEFLNICNLISGKNEG